MSDDVQRATVDYWKDGKIGDLVWRIGGNESVYENGAYKGRGRWYLEPITKIGRKYKTVGEGHDFSIERGSARVINGYALPDYAYGEFEKWSFENIRKIRLEVELCHDINRQIAIARILGIDTPETKP